MPLRSIFATALILLPTATFAATVQFYDFRSGFVNTEWNGIGDIAMEQLADGVRLTTGVGTGVLVTQTEPPFLADMGRIKTTSAEQVELMFLWSFRSSLQSATNRVTMLIDDMPEAMTLFPLSQHPEWREEPKNFGILIPPNHSIVVHTIELVKLSLGEKIKSLWSSFWTFDEYRPYSINFVWGPVFGTNPAEISLLYRYLPPQFLMGMKAIHIFLACTLIIGGIAYAITRKKIIPKILFVLLLGTWIVLDARMGSEFLSWVKHDHDAYIAAPAGMREFRDRDRFYDFAEFVKPLVHDRQRYIFFASYPWPYLGNLRYITYPTLPAFNLREDDTWVIYDRPDIGVSADGRLVIEGSIVSEPGKVLGAFEQGSFVFRGHPLPLPE